MSITEPKKRGRPKKLPAAERIANALDITNDHIVNVENKLVTVNETPNNKKSLSVDIKDDYNFSRNNIKDLLEKGNKLLNNAIELAENDESPRSFEVASNLVKILIDGSRELLAVQKDLANLEKETIAVPLLNANSSNENSEKMEIVFEGTSLDMLDVLEEIRRKKKEKHNG